MEDNYNNIIFNYLKISILSSFLLLCAYNAQGQSLVTLDINWPTEAEDNIIQVRDAANNNIYQTCNPTSCFTGNNSNASYVQYENLLLNPGNYRLLLVDRPRDGWKGGTVRVVVDGIEVLAPVTMPPGPFTRFVNFTVTDTGVVFNSPLTLFDEFDGNYDYAVAGGSLRDQDDATDPCSITTSSSANGLTSPIPAGAVIEKAYLFWAQSSIDRDDQVTFEGQTVTPDVVNSFAAGTTSYFGMVSDVTSIISGIPNPSTNVYDFSDLTILTNADYCGSTVIGAWSVMIFYRDPSLSATTINLYNGFNGLQNTNPPQSFLLDNFFANGSAGAKTTILSWEGDIALANAERLTVTPASTGIAVELNGDGDNDGLIRKNPFNSTVFDGLSGVDLTEYGLDLDTYDISAIIPVGETSLTTDVDVGDDLVILNSVILKVSSNLITGHVFEDINYGGGPGRSLITSSGALTENATVELYRETIPGTFILDDTTTTDSSGKYVFGGMINGNYRVRVVNSSVRSSRGGGSICTICLPIQTFRTENTTGTNIEISNEVGGANPLLQDTAAGTITGAQSFSDIVINNQGIIDINFGFNFNTIVNTNENGQGSLEQFIINTNNLDEIGLDINSHPNDATFDPANGEDYSIFMIPSSSDPLGRTADPNFASGYFNIFISNSTDLTPLSANNTIIDGQTQTLYSGDTNLGNIASSGNVVGTSATALPDYNLPEIQVHQNNGNVFTVAASNIEIKNLSIYANNNAGVQIDSGEIILSQNLIGVNALGSASGDIRFGVRVNGGIVAIENNYISENIFSGILVDGGTSTLIRNNHIFNNGAGNVGNLCNDNIRLLNGTNITITTNLIENATSIGVDGSTVTGNITITDNTITTSGSDITCTENSGIRLSGDNSSIVNNILHTNGGAGIILTGANTSGNIISQNSIYNNGTVTPALGIDLNDDDITLNDVGDSDIGANRSNNFPILESAAVSGTSLKVVGWARPGSIIELFLTDVDQGTALPGANQFAQASDYGEGQVYLATVTEGSGADLDTSSSAYSVDGNNDNTARFNFNITLSAAIPVGSSITATATTANSTSEFSGAYILGAKSVITNRRITHRVKKN